jgi:hypothetical protein
MTANNQTVLRLQSRQAATLKPLPASTKAQHL